MTTKQHGGARPAVRDDDRRHVTSGKREGSGRRDGWRVIGTLWGIDIIHDVKRKPEAAAIVRFIQTFGGTATAEKITIDAIIV